MGKNIKNLGKIRNFPDKDTGFGTTDGYFELYVSTDNGKSKTKLLRSDTISDQENPDWGQVFENFENMHQI